MAYKVRLGHAEMSGTLGTDDIHYTEDSDTLIDFGSDRIKLKTNNTSRLGVGNNRISIKDQLVVGSVDVGTWALTPPSEDVLHVQDGTTIFQKNSADAFPPTVAFNKSRNATDGSNTIVQDNDCLGYIHFMGNDGAGYEEAACIAAYVDGAPGSDDMPGRLVFATTPDGDNEVADRMTIDSSGKVGIGTSAPDYALDVAGDIGINQRIYHNDDDDTYINLTENRIRFTAGNLNLFGMHKKSSSPHQVTVNNGGNNVDFVVNDNSSNTIFRTDASTSRIGIATGSPTSTLSVAGSIALNVTSLNSSNDPGTTYSMTATDCVLLINTRPTAQGGIDSTITVTLPAASSFPGRIVTIKDAAGYCDVNAITISRAGSDTINGVDTTISLPTPGSFKTLISDGVDSWQEIGS